MKEPITPEDYFRRHAEFAAFLAEERRTQFNGAGRGAAGRGGGVWWGARKGVRWVSGMHSCGAVVSWVG